MLLIITIWDVTQKPNICVGGEYGQENGLPGTQANYKQRSGTLRHQRPIGGIDDACGLAEC